MTPPTDGLTTRQLLQALLDQVMKLQELPERLTRVETEVKNINSKMDMVHAVAESSRDRLTRIEQCIPERHIAVHERLENKVAQHQGNWQSIFGYITVIVNGILAWVVSQGLH